MRQGGHFNRSAGDLRHLRQGHAENHARYLIAGISGDFSYQSSSYVGLWILTPLYITVFVLSIALARMAKASNATPGKCTTPKNMTVRSRKDDLPSEVTELGSVVN